MTGRKIRDIRDHFAPVLGQTIRHYETAERLLEDGSWTCWPDLPIRLYTGPDTLVAVSWSHLDDLWLSNDTSLPFSTAGSEFRWVVNGIGGLDAVVGDSIRSVMLGRGEMSIEGRPVEIRTRLLLQLTRGWMEICNALDENGYSFHAERPAGDFIPCLEIR